MSSPPSPRCSTTRTSNPACSLRYTSARLICCIPRLRTTSRPRGTALSSSSAHGSGRGAGTLSRGVVLSRRGFFLAVQARGGLPCRVELAALEEHALARERPLVARDGVALDEVPECRAT